MEHIKFFLKRRIIALLKFWPGYARKWNLPAGTKTLDDLIGNYQLLYEYSTEIIERKVPVTLGRVHEVFKQYRVTPSFKTTVVRVRNWRIWSNQGAVVTSDNYLYVDASREFDNKVHSIFNQQKLVEAIPQSGKTTVLAASGGGIYYHWMFDILPRLDILKKSGEFSEIENFVINYQSKRFQKETLEKAGIDLSKIIPSLNHWEFHIKVSDLIIPSLISSNNTPSLTACQYLRELFLPQEPSAAEPVNIYIKRTTGRRVLNEEALVSFLKKWKFQVFALEHMSVTDQAALFARAKMVVGAHGSGFTNIVFCKPGTLIVDIFASDWINPCYWIIAEHMQLKYGYLMSNRNLKSLSLKKSKNTDILVNLDSLSSLLAKLDVS